MFPGKFMNFSEAATEGVLRKKLYLKTLQYSQERFQKQTPTQEFSSAYCKIFENTFFEEHLPTTASDFFKQLQNSGEQWLLYLLFY